MRLIRINDKVFVSPHSIDMVELEIINGVEVVVVTVNGVRRVSTIPFDAFSQDLDVADIGNVDQWQQFNAL